MSRMNCLSVTVLAAATLSACAAEPPEQLNAEARSAALELPGAAEAKELIAANPSYSLFEQADGGRAPVDATTAASHSFTQTCRVPLGWVTDNSNGAIVFAFSDGGCRRFNGTFGGPTSWSGTCFGDVSNCNGSIVCQNHCP